MKEILLWVLVMQAGNAIASSDDDIEMLTDIVRSYERPSFVVANVCWTQRHKRYFIKLLSNLEQRVTIRYSDEESILRYSLLDETNILFVIDLACSSAKNILEKVNATGTFRNPFRWLVIGVKEDTIPEQLKDLHVLIDSEVLLTRDLGGGSYRLEFVYKIGVTSGWITELYGFWDSTQRLQKALTLTGSTGIRRRDLQQSVIPIVYVTSDPDTVNNLIDSKDPLVDTITKVNFRTTNYLLDSLNAGRKFFFAPNWGYKINGSWNGLTGYLVRGEAEIGGSPLFLTAERLPFIDYLTSPIPTLSKFVFQQPNLSYENNIFMLSFRTSVWYSLMALILLIFLVLFLVAYWEWKKKDEFEMRDIDSSILRPDISDIVLLVLGATCQQGSSVELKGALGRIVMFVIFLTLMFLYTSYSANIVALLQSSSSQIQTLEDLLNSRLKCSVHNTSFNRYYFSTITEATRKAIYQRKVAPPGVEPRFMSLDDGVKSIQKGLHAFHMETGVGYNVVARYFQESEKCRLKELQYLFALDPWVAVRKNSPYKEIFKVRLTRMQEHGLQNRENLLLYAKRPKCTGGDASFVSVSMVDCYPVVLVLVYGMLLAVFFLAVEVLHFRRSDVAYKLPCLRKNHDYNTS